MSRKTTNRANLRRTRSLEQLILWLSLRGVSTGEFSEALQAILGPDAPGLSATSITRLKANWGARRSLGANAPWRPRSLVGPKAGREVK